MLNPCFSTTSRILGYRGPAVDEDAPAHRLASQDDVFGDGEIRDQLEMLVHHADPQAVRIQGAVDGHLSAAQRDSAGAGLLQSVEDLHERRLAGPVLADDRVDLVLLDGEIHAIIGKRSVGVELGYALHLKV